MIKEVCARMSRAKVIGSGTLAVFLLVVLVGCPSIIANVVSTSESLQRAIDQAQAGDTITVQGTHQENVTIDKNDLTLEGENGASIDANVTVTADGATIRNLTITGVLDTPTGSFSDLDLSGVEIFDQTLNTTLSCTAVVNEGESLQDTVDDSSITDGDTICLAPGVSTSGLSTSKSLAFIRIGVGEITIDGPTPSKIAYQCASGGNREICVLNSDGSGDIETITSSGFGGEPSINANDRIAYECFDGDLEICAINADGTDQTQLTHNSVTDQRPSINADGRIAYMCDDGNGFAEICAIDDDGTNQTKLTSYSDHDEDPNINDNGRVAYVRIDTGGTDHIFAIDADGTDQIQVTTGSGNTSKPVLNNNGGIAYECFGSSEVCTVNADGTGEASLSLGSNPSLNNNGRIVYECQDPNSVICVINANGTSQAQLTSNSTDDDLPSINDDGRIAYVCNDGDAELCVINEDGSGQDKLTNNSVDDDDPSIQN